MLDKANLAARVFPEKTFEARLADFERQGTHVLAPDEKEIEREIDQAFAFAFRQRGLECCEIRGAVFVQSNHLAVDDAIRKLRG